MATENSYSILSDIPQQTDSSSPKHTESFSSLDSYIGSPKHTSSPNKKQR